MTYIPLMRNLSSMSLTIHSLLQPQRRLWCITQKELANLLNISSDSQVSKLENGKAKPNLSTAIGTYVLFGVEIKAMFPQFWSEIEESVMRNMASFYERIAAGTSAKYQRKREFAHQAQRRVLGTDAQSGANVRRA